MLVYDAAACAMVREDTLLAKRGAIWRSVMEAADPLASFLCWLLCLRWTPFLCFLLQWELFFTLAKRLRLQLRNLERVTRRLQTW